MAIKRGNRQTGPVTTIGSPTAYMVLLFAMPILVFLIYSFWQLEGFDIVPEWTLKNYVQVVNNPVYINSGTIN